MTIAPGLSNGQEHAAFAMIGSAVLPRAASQMYRSRPRDVHHLEVPPVLQAFKASRILSRWLNGQTGM